MDGTPSKKPDQQVIEEHQSATMTEITGYSEVCAIGENTLGYPESPTELLLQKYLLICS
jgi:hypothetical protein